LSIRYIFVLIYVVTALIAIFAIPSYEEAGMQAFEDPSSISNSFIYFGAILGFTAFILVIAKYRESLLHLLMFLLVLVSIYYVFLPFLGNFSIVPSAIVVYLLLKKSNWLVIDISALLLAAGITSIFGISLEPIPVIVLMVVLAIYDAISVYKTKHMISLAESVTKLKLPMLFIVPYSRKFRLEELKDAKGKASFMGVGDAVIPNILVVSAQTFSNSPSMGFIKVSALSTLIGGVIGLLVLLYLMEKKSGAHPGLPFLNSGAIAGFILSYWL